MDQVAGSRVLVAYGALFVAFAAWSGVVGCSSEGPGFSGATDDNASPKGNRASAGRKASGSLDGGTPIDELDGASSPTDTPDANAPPPIEQIPACSPACGARSVCVAGVCSEGRRVFASSRAYRATFGGHGGADAVCATLAGAADLPGTYMAWLSDSMSSPSARFSKSTAPYRLVDGALVAANWDGLVSGSLQHAIDRDERGKLVQNTEVWTATEPNGTASSDTCNNFSLTDAGATPAPVGLSSKTNREWSNVYKQFCDRTNLRIYCVEQ